MDEWQLRINISEVVRQSVEETLSSLLEAEAGGLVQGTPLCALRGACQHPCRVLSARFSDNVGTGAESIEELISLIG